MASHQIRGLHDANDLLHDAENFLHNLPDRLGEVSPEDLERELHRHHSGMTAFLQTNLGPVDKPRPDTDASEQDESHEAGGELIISGGDATLLLEMPNETLNP